MEPTQTDTAALADAISGTLRLARALVQAKRRVDLTGLEAEAGRLCAACLDLPPEQARALRPHLLAVLGDLDAVEAAMRGAAP